MHDDLAQPWTLESLAQRAGLSRKVLAESDQRLEAVAASVGYQDAFGFSKVFKRTAGLSPKAFRQRGKAERGHAWRFGVA